MSSSGALHSFVHPSVVKSMGVEPSQGAALTVTVTNGNQVLCHDVFCFKADLFSGGWRLPGGSALWFVCA